MPTIAWPPPPWPDSRLRADADRSLMELNRTQQDVAGRRAAYAEYFDEGAVLFDELMRRSDSLLNLAGTSFGSDSELVAMGRFTGGPLISHDDLERMVGKGLGNKTINPERASAAAKQVAALLDARRFPWVAESRQPRAEEVLAARVATATLWATQRTQTGERAKARALEAKVKHLLQSVGLAYVRRPTAGLPWSLGPGQFCGEGNVNGTNCDVIAHLQAHQKALLIECKVSGTPINGTKRLKSIKEAAAVWWRGFGEQVLPVGVISGAFTMRDLSATQRDGIFLVWEHDLTPLSELVRQHGIDPYPRETSE